MDSGIRYLGVYHNGVDCGAGGILSCLNCALFNKKSKICVEKHMGFTPDFYNSPQNMGCSWWKDPNKDILTLFEEEENES